MKKARLFGMLALAAALVFGAASCKQESESWDDLKKVLDDGEDLSGTWKITKASGYMEMLGEKESFDSPEDFFDDDELEVNLTKDTAKVYFTTLLGTIEGMGEDMDKTDFSAEINGDRNEIKIYAYAKSSTPVGDVEMELNFTIKKQ